MASMASHGEVVYDMFVGDVVHIDAAVYELWVEGLKASEAAEVRLMDTKAAAADAEAQAIAAAMRARAHSAAPPAADAVAASDGADAHGTGGDGLGAAVARGGGVGSSGAAGPAAAAQPAATRLPPHPFASAVTTRKEDDELLGFLLLDTKEQYRLYKELLEQYLQEPELLGKQLECHLEGVTEQYVLERYYSFSPMVFRDLLGRAKLTSWRLNVDDISEATRVPMQAVRRQYDNLRRVFEAVDDEEDFDQPVCRDIQEELLVSHALAWHYTCMLFLVKNRFYLDNTKGSGVAHLTWHDLRFCASVMMVFWVPGGADYAPPDVYLDAGLAVDGTAGPDVTAPVALAAGIGAARSVSDGSSSVTPLTAMRQASTGGASVGPVDDGLRGIATKRGVVSARSGASSGPGTGGGRGGGSGGGRGEGADTVDTSRAGAGGDAGGMAASLLGGDRDGSIAKYRRGSSTGSAAETAGSGTDSHGGAADVSGRLSRADLLSPSPAASAVPSVAREDSRRVGGFRALTKRTPESRLLVDPVLGASLKSLRAHMKKGDRAPYVDAILRLVPECSAKGARVGREQVASIVRGMRGISSQLEKAAAFRDFFGDLLSLVVGPVVTMSLADDAIVKLFKALASEFPSLRAAAAERAPRAGAPDKRTQWDRFVVAVGVMVRRFARRSW